MSKSLIVYFLFSVDGNKNIKAEWLYVPSEEKAEKEIKEFLAFAYEGFQTKILSKTFYRD